MPDSDTSRFAEGIPPAMLEAIFETMTDGVVLFDAERRVLAANPAMGLLIGAPVESLLGRRAADAWGEMNTPPPENSDITTTEETLRRADGDTRIASVRTFSPAGHPGYHVSIYRDITRQKRSQERLRSARDLYQVLVENVWDGIALLQGDQLVFVNPRFAEMFGYTPEDLSGRDVECLLTAEAADRLAALRARRRQALEPPGQMELRLRNREGREIEVEAHFAFLVWKGEETLLCVFRNVTGRRRQETRKTLLTEMTRRLTSVRRPREVAATLLETADALIGWDAAFVSLFASDIERKLLPGRALISLIHYDVINGRRQEVDTPDRPDVSTSPAYRSLIEGPILIRRKPGEIPNVPQPFGDVSRPSATLMYCPIISQEQIVGVCSIQSYAFDAYDEEDLHALRDLADACSAALERTRAEERVRLLEMAVRHSSDMILITASDPQSPTGTSVIFANEAFCRFTGYAPEELLGRPISMLQGKDSDPEVYRRLREALLRRRPITVELTNYRKDGSPYEVEISTYPLIDPQGPFSYFVSLQRDITERRRRERELAHKAYHDPLTNLPNRSLLRSRLEAAIADARERNFLIALLYLDLDNFKAVNDQRGHDTGDRLLVELARRLETCVRPTDTVARYGGDEFVILLVGLRHASEAQMIVDRVVRVTADVYRFGDQEVRCGASVGVAFPDLKKGETAEDLLRRADRALLSAKSLGKGRPVTDTGEVEEFPEENGVGD